jgi:hypothetical protein
MIVDANQQYKEEYLLDSKINMFLDAITEVSVGREVLLPQLVFLDLEATLQDLFSLETQVLPIVLRLKDHDTFSIKSVLEGCNHQFRRKMV